MYTLCQHPEGCLNHTNWGKELCETHEYELRKKERDNEKENNRREKALQMAEERAKRYAEKARAKKLDAGTGKSSNGRDAGISQAAKRKDEGKKQGRIKPRSKRRAAEEREYLKERNEWLERPENSICAVCIVEQEPIPQRATQVHHKKGRIGKLLLDKRFWLGVCDEHHRVITEHSAEAIRKGYSLPRNRD